MNDKQTISRLMVNSSSTSDVICYCVVPCKRSHLAHGYLENSSPEVCVFVPVGVCLQASPYLDTWWHGYVKVTQYVLCVLVLCALPKKG